MDSVINVGAPVYAQLQELQGNELDEAPDADSKVVSNTNSGITSTSLHH